MSVAISCLILPSVSQLYRTELQIATVLMETHE